MISGIRPYNSPSVKSKPAFGHHGAYGKVKDELIDLKCSFEKNPIKGVEHSLDLVEKGVKTVAYKTMKGACLGLIKSVRLLDKIFS